MNRNLPFTFCVAQKRTDGFFLEGGIVIENRVSLSGFDDISIEELVNFEETMAT